MTDPLLQMTAPPSYLDPPNENSLSASFKILYLFGGSRPDNSPDAFNLFSRSTSLEAVLDKIHPRLFDLACVFLVRSCPSPWNHRLPRYEKCELREHVTEWTQKKESLSGSTHQHWTDEIIIPHKISRPHMWQASSGALTQLQFFLYRVVGLVVTDFLSNAMFMCLLLCAFASSSEADLLRVDSAACGATPWPILRSGTTLG